MKRALLPAIAAIVVLIGASIGVWQAIVANVGVAVAAQSRLAGELLRAGAPTGMNLATTLQRSGVIVRVLDLRSGARIEANSTGVVMHADPPDGAFPAGGPPPDGPPGEPPPGGTPGAPLGGLPPRRAPGLLAATALSLAHIRAVHLEGAQSIVDVAPDGRQLALWLVLDTGTTALAVLAVVLAAVADSVSRARKERRQLEAHAIERSEAAARYQRFLADTGHELRTPLTVLAGYVEILRARAVDDALDARIFEGLHAETIRMRALVEKMMTFARLETDVAVPRLIDVATAVREAATTLERRCPDRVVHVRTASSDSIVIDADDLAAALGNLLENAEKYAPGSPITITTEVAASRARIAVIDHGPGVDAAAQATMFERFVRGRDRAYGEGLGLGLAIVKRVADRWNGSVACTSANGTTVFALEFPLANEERHEHAG